MLFNGILVIVDSADSRAGEVAGARRNRVLQLPCGADKLRGTPGIPRPCQGSLATLAQAAKSEGQHDIRADEEAGQRLASKTAYPSSVATRPLRRQTPEVGAVCGNPARTVLCGGHPVMGVPTAINMCH